MEEICECGSKPSDSMKVDEFLPVEQLSVFQESPCTV